MADAPSGGGWSALEIGFVIVLAIGFLTQLQGGFKSTPDTATPKTTDTSTAPNELPCGLVLSRPHSLEKVSSFVTLMGRVEGCQWPATQSAALYAQVIDSRGKPLSAYTLVPPLSLERDSAGFDTVIGITTVPTTTKGFLLLVPARNVASQTSTYRIPLTFVR